MIETMEEVLVERAKKGDKEAFTQLYAKVYKDLYCFALYTLKNKEEAEDAVSASVIAAYESIKKLRKNTAFRSWMFRIVLNQCNRTMKKRMYSSEWADEQKVEVDMAENAALWEAFSKLKEKEQKILLLSILGGYSSKEIAGMMHMSSGNVRSVKSRTLEHLRIQLS